MMTRLLPLFLAALLIGTTLVAANIEYAPTGQSRQLARRHHPKGGHGGGGSSSGGDGSSGSGGGSSGSKSEDPLAGDGGTTLECKHINPFYNIHLAPNLKLCYSPGDTIKWTWDVYYKADAIPNPSSRLDFRLVPRGGDIGNDYVSLIDGNLCATDKHVTGTIPKDYPLDKSLVDFYVVILGEDSYQPIIQGKGLKIQKECSKK